MNDKTNILFKQIRPNGTFGLVFLHLGLEEKRGIASILMMFNKNTVYI